MFCFVGQLRVAPLCPPGKETRAIVATVSTFADNAHSRSHAGGSGKCRVRIRSHLTRGNGASSFTDVARVAEPRKATTRNAPGRESHHPLLAVLGEAQCALHAWLRAGNTNASRGVSHFLCEALALLPAGWKLRTVRADSGFFSEELLEFLEERGLTYIVVACLTSHVRRKAVGLHQGSTWTKTTR